MKKRFDFLQIRDNRPLSQWKTKCIARLQELMLPIDTYTLIDLPYYEELTDTVNASDTIRMKWLSEHLHGVWVDDDCYLEERWVPPQDNIVCLPRNGVNENSPDYFLIYVNNNPGWIRKNLSIKKRDEWVSANVSVENRKSFYGYPLTLLQKLTGFQCIPENIYIHGYETLHTEEERRGREMEKKVLTGSDLAKMIESQQQPTRKLDDVVNEEVVVFDSAFSRIKTTIFQMKNVINNQANIITNLRTEIETLKKKLDVDVGKAAPVPELKPQNVIPLKE